jgi:hypothetical protein
MLVGFIHGVMNTDNVTVSVETIDYGPCAFLEVYDPNRLTYEPWRSSSLITAGTRLRVTARVRYERRDARRPW